MPVLRRTLRAAVGALGRDPTAAPAHLFLGGKNLGGQVALDLRQHAAARRRPVPDGLPAAPAGPPGEAPGRSALPDREPDAVPAGRPRPHLRSRRAAQDADARRRADRALRRRRRRTATSRCRRSRPRTEDEVRDEISARSTSGSRRCWESTRLSDASDLYFAQIPVGQMANLAYLIGSRSDPRGAGRRPGLERRRAARPGRGGRHAAWSARSSRTTTRTTSAARSSGMEIEGVARLLERAPMPIYVNEHEADGTRKVTGASESDLVREDGRRRDRARRDPRAPAPHAGPHAGLAVLPGRGGRASPGELVSGDTLFLGSCGRVDLPGATRRRCTGA